MESSERRYSELQACRLPSCHKEAQAALHISHTNRSSMGRRCTKLERKEAHPRYTLPVWFLGILSCSILGYKPIRKALRKTKEKGYWRSTENRRQFFIDFAQGKGFDPTSKEEWEKITNSQVHNHKVRKWNDCLYLSNAKNKLFIIYYYSSYL